MDIYIKESLYVLDYRDNVVEPIFISDDHRTPGYAYDITITESNMGYSDLTFSMPTKILPMPNTVEEALDDQGFIDNPKIALLPPLTKVRYHREIMYKGTEEIKVYEPEGYGDEINYVEKTYKPTYPDNIIEDYVMDYIIQPLDTTRSNLQVSISYTAMDYPRFNLSKKKFGSLIDDDTVTRTDWSIWSKEPMSVPGEVEYVPWSTSYLPGTSATWDPTSGEYPLTYEQVQELMKQTAVWPYGLTATLFYWPITKTGRFEGVLYPEGDYITLAVYQKSLVQVTDVRTVEMSTGKYACDIMTCFADGAERSWKPSGAATYAQIDVIEGVTTDSQYKGYVYDVNSLPSANNYNQGDWMAIVTDISQSLEFYGYDWLTYDKGRPYLTPNGAANYLNWALENTNWSIKTRESNYIGTYFAEADLPSSGIDEGAYALVKTITSDDLYLGTVNSLPANPGTYGKWCVLATNQQGDKCDTAELYLWDTTNWYIDYTDLTRMETAVYQYKNNEWTDITKEALALSIDKTTGVLYDVDTPTTEVFMPLADSEGITESRLTTNINVSESNCYNVITEICRAFQLYPVFDCVNRTVALRMFAGKNYGLTYNLGLSIQNDNRTDDGEQVITKLRCYGGQDYNGEEAINLGDANRQAAVDRIIQFDTSLPANDPTEYTDELYHIYIIDPDLDESQPWVAGPDRTAKMIYNQQWYTGIKNEDGTFTFELPSNTVIIDGETGLNAPWDPNDPIYIFARSPYGTEYIYNFKYLYEKGWMTKGDILGVYKKSLEIQDINNFVVSYAKAYTDCVDAYTAAVVDYETYQDEYMSIIDNMRNKYWYDISEAHYGTFMAFPSADYPGDIQVVDNKHGVKVYWCSNPECLAVKPTPDDKCPVCGSANGLEEHFVPLPTWSEIANAPSSPATGDESRDLKVTGNFTQIKQKFKDKINSQYIKMATPWDVRTSSSNITQHEFRINCTWVEDQTDLLFEWNDKVKRWMEYYGLTLGAQKRIEKYQTLVEKIVKAYEIYRTELGKLEDYIQDNWGDYIVEGKFQDDTICYTSILMAKSLEASEQYSIPKTTYGLNVVDSSGLIEYRSSQKGIYNDLVHHLHSVGQIVPKAGDYVTIYDKAMNFNGVPATITQITRVIDNPMNNGIVLDTSYTDNDELVGNIITATNTVLSNSDIYARTAVINGDGTLTLESINKTLQNGANSNISMVGSKGSYVLDSTGMTTVDPNNEKHKMKYGGAGIFASSDDGATWQKLMDANGINANYISAGLIDTRKIQISSGAADAKVILNTNGLIVKTDPTKGYSIPTLDPGQTIHNWTNANNVSAFIGVDNNNQAAVHIEGDITALSGKIGGWSIGSDCLYSGEGASYVALSTTSDTRIWAGGTTPNTANFSIDKNGKVIAKDMEISGGALNLTDGGISDERITVTGNPIFFPGWDGFWYPLSKYYSAQASYQLYDDPEHTSIAWEGTFSATSINLLCYPSGDFPGSEFSVEVGASASVLHVGTIFADKIYSNNIAAGTGTASTGGTWINFGKTFTSTPIVVISYRDPGSGDLPCLKVNNTSTTGFTAMIGGAGTGNQPINWIAFLP